MCLNQAAWKKVQSRSKKVCNIPQGSLLIEALLITVILSVSLTLIIHSLLSSLRAMGYVASYSTAALLLENKMDLMLAAKGWDEDFFERKGSDPTASTASSDDYQYSFKRQNISKDDQIGTLEEVDARISWKQGRRNNTIGLTTYLFHLPGTK